MHFHLMVFINKFFIDYYSKCNLLHVLLHNITTFSSLSDEMENLAILESYLAYSI